MAKKEQAREAGAAGRAGTKRAPAEKKTRKAPAVAPSKPSIVQPVIEEPKKKEESSDESEGEKSAPEEPEEGNASISANT